jgi:hypothetical protein
MTVFVSLTDSTGVDDEEYLTGAIVAPTFTNCTGPTAFINSTIQTLAPYQVASVDGVTSGLHFAQLVDITGPNASVELGSNQYDWTILSMQLLITAVDPAMTG